MTFQTFNFHLLCLDWDAWVCLRVKCTVFNLLVFFVSSGLGNLSLFLLKLCFQLLWEGLLVTNCIYRINLVVLICLRFKSTVFKLLSLLLFLGLLFFSVSILSFVYDRYRRSDYRTNLINLRPKRQIVIHFLFFNCNQMHALLLIVYS